jgi:hypothetical protein
VLPANVNFVRNPREGNPEPPNPANRGLRHNARRLQRKRMGMTSPMIVAIASAQPFPPTTRHDSGANAEFDAAGREFLAQVQGGDNRYVHWLVMRADAARPRPRQEMARCLDDG